MIVIDGLKVSSSRYRSRMEGSPTIIRMMDGEMVQNVSMEWDSSIFRLIMLFLIEEYIFSPTKVIIVIIIVSEKS